MASRDMIVGGMLGNMLFPGSEDWSRMDNPMGRPSTIRDDTSVHAIQKAKNGNVLVTFNTPDHSMAAAVARENFRRLGIESPFVGRKAVRMEGTWEGNNLAFDVNGKKVTLNEQALANARGTELAHLLGVKSFMDFNKIQTERTSGAMKPALTDAQPKLDPKASQADVPLPPTRPAEFAPTPQTGQIETQAPLQQAAIPSMLMAPPAMLPLAVQSMQNPMAMQPMIPGYMGMMQSLMPNFANPTAGMPPMNGAGKQSKKGLPGIGSAINPLGPYGGGDGNSGT